MLPASGRITFLMAEHCKIRMGGSVPVRIDIGPAYRESPADNCVVGNNTEEMVRETPIPIDRLACLMLGPGTSISQDAIKAFAVAPCMRG